VDFLGYQMIHSAIQLKQGIIMNGHLGDR